RVRYTMSRGIEMTARPRGSCRRVYGIPASSSAVSTSAASCGCSRLKRTSWPPRSANANVSTAKPRNTNPAAAMMTRRLCGASPVQTLLSCAIICVSRSFIAPSHIQPLTSDCMPQAPPPDPHGPAAREREFSIGKKSDLHPANLLVRFDHLVANGDHQLKGKARLLGEDRHLVDVFNLAGGQPLRGQLRVPLRPVH